MMKSNWRRWQLTGTGELDLPVEFGSSGERVPKLFAHKAAKDELVSRAIPVPCSGFFICGLEDARNCFTGSREATKKK